MTKEKKTVDKESFAKQVVFFGLMAVIIYISFWQLTPTGELMMAGLHDDSVLDNIMAFISVAGVVGSALGLFASALLALIPAHIADKKGYNHYYAWWLLGTFAFIIALIIIIVLPDKNKDREENMPKKSYAEQLKKYKSLLDSGAISEEEYNEKKRQLLSK